MRFPWQKKTEAETPIIPPSPHEIALQFAAALLSSPKFADDHSAAVSTAWTLVMAYYQGEEIYRQTIEAMYAAAYGQYASEPEPQMSRAEQRAYVGGESDPDDYREFPSGAH